MTQEQKRIAIAEKCGYRTGYRDPEAWHPLPDYFNDLNAMHEAEKMLAEKQRRSYAFTLAQVLDTTPTVDLDDQFINIHATAAQRAEAFLRTIGKWKD